MSVIQDPFSPNLHKTTQSFRQLSSSPMRAKKRNAATELKDYSSLGPSRPSQKKSFIYNSSKVVKANNMGPRKGSPQRLRLPGKRKISLEQQQ